FLTLLPSDHQASHSFPTRRSSDLNAHVDRSLVRGIAWTGSVKWAVQVLSWASTLVIVRHVTPADYGIVGSATLYLGLLTLVADLDRKSTRLNSSHVKISYAVFCLK